MSFTAPARQCAASTATRLAAGLIVAGLAGCGDTYITTPAEEEGGESSSSGDASPGDQAIADPSVPDAPVGPAEASEPVQPVAPQLLLDPQLADLDTLALALRGALRATAGEALATANAGYLAGSLDEDALGCVSGEYPLRTWFCGDDGARSPLSSGTAFVDGFDFLASEACDLAIASDTALDACRLRFAEFHLADGSAASYRFRVVGGVERIDVQLLARPEDLQAGVGLVDGNCEIRFETASGAIGYSDEAVCERDARGALTGL